ncbi:imidazole glycerol phosphate synthase subunit HisH [PVC group bacterium]|nr:imidazole glycerol phosphate synthase subunit HisH [PVC group bacterium]
MIAIIDYKAGNLTSVKLAFNALGIDSVITDSPEKILSADRVVFPGVGAAASSMQKLHSLNLIEAIRTVADNGTPFLGICLGTQIILEHSEENNGTKGIGLITGNVIKFSPADPLNKVPQMGWNSVSQTKSHPVFNGIENDSEFYFVHSYYPVPTDFDNIIGTTDYAGFSFSSVLGRKNIIATQFHPEKSGRIGLKLLENFCSWNPTEK